MYFGLSEEQKSLEENISKSEDFGTSLDYIYRRQPGSLWIIFTCLTSSLSL